MKQSSMKQISKALCMLLTFGALSTNAEEKPASERPAEKGKFQWLAGLGITAGGDDLIKVSFENSSSETLEAGGLVDLKVGILYDLTGSPVSLQSTLGYHFDSVHATNGDASFSRFPLDMLGFYHIEKHRIGGGLSYHLGTELDADLPGLNGTVDMENALGLVLEYGYEFQKNLIVGVRYLNIDYKVDGGTGAKIDGSHGGLYGYITF